MKEKNDGNILSARKENARTINQNNQASPCASGLFSPETCTGITRPCARFGGFFASQSYSINNSKRIYVLRVLFGMCGTPQLWDNRIFFYDLLHACTATVNI